MGFARGAKVVASDVQEIPFDTLPVCVELIAPRPLLDRFVHDCGKELRDATLVMHEGVHLRPFVEPSPEPVEYVRVEEPAEPARVAVEEVEGALEGSG